MMRKTAALLLLAGIAALAVACAGGDAPDADAGGGTAPESVIADHMVAEATITAHYIAAARRAGMTSAEINATLRQIASGTIISEFWVSDADGDVEFSSVPDASFSFGTDPDAGRQAAPFVNLLLGRESVVVQEAQPRDLDGEVFRYVGVSGVDGRRIVQVGLRGGR